MEAFVSCWNGKQYVLPDALEWEFSYGLGSPCDSFALTCLWEPGGEMALGDAVRFWAAHGEKRVFTGIVDEYRCLRDEAGSRLELSGRGLQGLLLDNETTPAEYQTATVKDILDRHIAPYGIETVGGRGLAAVKGFSAASGQSEWSVLHEFVCRGNGIVPRFDREGRLLLSGWEGGAALQVGDGTAVTRLSYGERRYGVLSQVVVQNRKLGTSVTVEDSDFKERGGRCRRVMTAGSEDGESAMRAAGEYQLRLARAGRVCCEVELPTLFAAFPGQLVKVARGGFGGNGTYRVAEAVTGAGSRGAYTLLTLWEPDSLV